MDKQKWIFRLVLCVVVMTTPFAAAESAQGQVALVATPTVSLTPSLVLTVIATATPTWTTMPVQIPTTTYTPTPTLPPTLPATYTPIPTFTATYTPTPMLTVMYTPTPALTTPLSSITTPTPTVTLINENPILVAAGLGVCVLLLLLFGILLWGILRRRKPQPPPLPMAPYLESVTSPGVRFDLTKDVVTLGRAKDCDIQITEKLPGAATVSRHHARLEKREGRWLVIDGDLNGRPSTNGVFVKGSRTRENYLDDGDEIALGQVVFRFHIQRKSLNPTSGGTR